MKSKSASSRLFVLLVLILTVAVCVTCGSTRPPRQGWSKQWGPVVPHEKFPADCSLCHLPDRWDKLREDFEFDHAKQTGLALNGVHRRAACLRCHNDLGPVKEYAARGCAGCHTDVHRGQLGTDCLRCHVETSWSPQGAIAEHARTRFPLIGAHLALACESCHVRAPTGDYSDAPVRCEDCHQTALARATSPDHAANGWTARCERCHIPTAWGDGGFSHSFFPLSGGHAIQDCTRCHVGGDFRPISADCYSCHQSDYEGAPNHVSSNYSRDCRQCHTTAIWEGAVFNHRFPLRGPHNVDCAVCHTGGNTSTFTCFACHDHSRARMDDKHDEVNGYRYASAACFQCHPDGKD